MLRERVGVYVDQANINKSGGYGMNYAALRNFALRGDAQGVHLNVYSAFDASKAEKDSSWSSRFMGYQSAIRQMGYHMKMKQAMVYEDGDRTTCKANVDVDIAVDVMESAARLDRVVLVTGDGDFASLILAARRLGSRVEVIAFDNCSAALRDAADAVFPAWLIPGILPSTDNRMIGVIEELCTDGSEAGMLRFMRDYEYAHNQPMMALAPENCNYAVFHRESISAPELNILRGAIVEFTAIGLTADDSSLTDYQAVDISPLRICTRSGWYKPYKAAAE